MLKVTTESGAVYMIDGVKVTGGSFNLQEGALMLAPEVGHSLLMLTPERGHLNPHYKNPSVMSSPIVEIEEVVT